MSADNTIAIFVFSDGLCKVKHMQAIENIHHSYDPVRNGEFNYGFLFGVLKDIELVDYSKAFEIAKKMESECCIVEYGITIHNIEKTWEELVDLTGESIENELKHIPVELDFLLDSYNQLLIEWQVYKGENSGS